MRMYIIEYEGRYWTGTGWTKKRNNAKQFVSSYDAWEYADYVFPEDIAEECGVEGIGA